MSRINLQKADKFYFLFVVLMLIIAVFTIYVFRTIFQSVTTAADIGTQFTEVEMKIDKEKLNEAVRVASEKKVLELEVR